MSDMLKSQGEAECTDISLMLPRVNVDGENSESHLCSAEARVLPKVDHDKDFLCPICIQTMKDAFLTGCGHSFCYMCIATHLNNRSNCPSCGAYLTSSQLYPNFLLNKMLKRLSANQLVSKASPAEHLCQALKQGADISIKELDSLLAVLTERKQKAEQEEAESNLEILLEFLYRSRQRKKEELNEIQADLQFLKEDIVYVEKKRQDLLRSKADYAYKICRAQALGKPSSIKVSSNSMDGKAPQESEITAMQEDAPSTDGQAISRIDASCSYDMTVSKTNEPPSESRQRVAAGLSGKRRRLLAQFEDLQDCYFQKKRAGKLKDHESGLKNESTHTLDAESIHGRGLDEFQDVLTAFTRYSHMRIVAELRHGDLFHSANIVSSIEFDRDDELFATAGVSRRIKIFEFATVVSDIVDVHFPVTEMVTRSKLSCLSWNKYIKGHIASTDYDGVVTIWDVNTRQSIREYEEHERRAWSVDFSRTDPTMLVSGSDDGKVKVWCTRQENSTMNIEIKANICSVKYNPGLGNYVAVGSSDHRVYYYDLRNVETPVYMLGGHHKAVSYVKFISQSELVSASTDCTLRLWNVRDNTFVRSFRGHTNDKNFVGLSVNSEFISCGSETNEVFAYHKAISKPVTCHKFGVQDVDESDEDSSHFISAVCWKSDSPTMLAANSEGTIKVLVLSV